MASEIPTLPISRRPTKEYLCHRQVFGTPSWGTCDRRLYQDVGVRLRLRRASHHLGRTRRRHIGASGSRRPVRAVGLARVRTCQRFLSDRHFQRDPLQSYSDDRQRRQGQLTTVVCTPFPASLWPCRKPCPAYPTCRTHRLSGHQCLERSKKMI